MNISNVQELLEGLYNTKDILQASYELTEEEEAILHWCEEATKFLEDNIVIQFSQMINEYVDGYTLSGFTPKVANNGQVPVVVTKSRKQPKKQEKEVDLSAGVGMAMGGTFDGLGLRQEVKPEVNDLDEVVVNREELLELQDEVENSDLSDMF